MSSVDTGAKNSPSINTRRLGAPVAQTKSASPQSTTRPRPAHSASHIRQRSIDLSDIKVNSPTARRMSMSSTPQDVTDPGEGVVARSLRYAEWVVAGLCAWSLLYVLQHLSKLTNIVLGPSFPSCLEPHYRPPLPRSRYPPRISQTVKTPSTNTLSSSHGYIPPSSTCPISTPLRLDRPNSDDWQCTS